MSIVPACRLCRAKGPLRNSHIIPEFMYEAVYDEKHRFAMRSAVSGERPKIEQKGIREPLLGECCEQRLREWETYVAHLWQGKEAVSHSRQGQLITLKGVDYPKLKLFQLSILWRAGVAGHPFFSKVDLGKHETALRARLLSADAGQAADYGCLMFGLAKDDRPVFEIIAEPTITRLDGHRCYRFLYGGMTWVHLVSGHAPSERLTRLFAQPDGTVHIGIGEMSEAGFLNRALQKIFA